MKDVRIRWSFLPPRQGLWPLLTALVLACTALLGMPASTEAGGLKLSGAMPAFGDVDEFRISPNGQYVVYTADQETDGLLELFSAPITGGSDPVKLNETLFPALGGIETFLIAPDSSRVVYVARQDDSDASELYSVPITGGMPVKLNDTLASDGQVEDTQVKISPDSSRVVYSADQDTYTIYELYSVPIAGGGVTKLNGTFAGTGDIWSFEISPDSSRVAYIADQDTPNITELYSVPLGGGMATKLNGTLPANGEVDLFHISPDSSRAVYIADQDSVNVIEIYSVPLSGGLATKLNDPPVTGGDIGFNPDNFQTSPDSSMVVFRADFDVDNDIEVYSAPLGGGTVTKLNGPLVSDGDIDEHLISPDSSRVIYLGDQDIDQLDEFYSVPIGGGAVAKLNGPMPTGGQVFPDYTVTADSSRVISRGDQETDQVFEVFSVPLAGGAVTKLSGPLPASADVQGFAASPNSDYVVYRADQDVLQDFELYHVPVLGGAPMQISSPLVAGGDVLSFAISPDGSRVVYAADQDTDEVVELYAAVIGLVDNALYLPVVLKAP